MAHKSVTVYGGVGDCLTGPAYKFYIGESTNAPNFHAFLKLLITKVKPNLACKPLIVFDQHKAHHKDYNMQLMQQNFYPFPQTSYSSSFNCIETVWSIAKRNFGKLLIQETRTIEMERHKQLVIEAV